MLSLSSELDLAVNISMHADRRTVGYRDVRQYFDDGVHGTVLTMHCSSVHTQKVDLMSIDYSHCTASCMERVARRRMIIPRRLDPTYHPPLDPRGGPPTSPLLMSKSDGTAAACAHLGCCHTSAVTQPTTRLYPGGHGRPHTQRIVVHCQ